MQEITFEGALDSILAKDPRYQREAYLFVKDALDYTQKLVARQNRQQLRHVTGQELLTGVREFALSQYGPMTKMVFAEWGIHRCEDFGELVFNMVEIGLLGKTEKDSRTDFANGYDFDSAFRQPFLPANHPERQPVLPKSAEA